jgi:hypothetical protein
LESRSPNEGFWPEPQSREDKLKLHQADLPDTSIRFSGKRSMLFVFLVFLGGIASGGALGATIEGVEMQPGEWTKTIPGIRQPADQDLNVVVSLPPLVCFVEVYPIRSGIMAASSDGSLAAKLAQLEAQPTSISGTVNAIRVFSPGSGSSGSPGEDRRPVTGITGTSPIRFRLDYGSLNAAWSAGRAAVVYPDDYQYGKLRECLSLSDAQAMVLTLREIIRRYLGMPPPSVPLQGLPPPQR